MSRRLEGSQFIFSGESPSASVVGLDSFELSDKMWPGSRGSGATGFQFSRVKPPVVVGDQHARPSRSCAPRPLSSEQSPVKCKQSAFKVRWWLWFEAGLQTPRLILFAREILLED